MLAEVPTDEARTYLLEQRFHYAYAAPVEQLRHRLMVVPRAAHGDQRLLDYGVKVSGSSADLSVASDGFGNHVVQMRAPAVAEWIEFSSWALLDQFAGSGVTRMTPLAAADDRLLAATELTRADHGLREVARDLAATSAGLDLAERACAWAYDALEYRWGVTGVHTTAAAAVAGGVGVCQDYAHVMLALCRAAGLPCRYVSGHLVGEGGSHAWVEVVVAGSAFGGAPAPVAVPFDPTHNRRVGADYFTVAVGRDYSDVPPTSGTFLGPYPGVLSTTKRLGPAQTRRFPSSSS